MTGFDLTIRLFGLLLGLGIAEVLGGFARTLRLKANITHLAAEQVHIGWLIPLLGTLVVFDQTSFWISFHMLEDHIPPSFLSMLGVLLVVGGFYVVSTFVFPQDPKLWPDFDAYYFRVRRIVIGGLLAINVAAVSYAYAIVRLGIELEPVSGDPNLVSNMAALAFMPTLAALLFVRDKGWSLALLALANAVLLTEAISLGR